MTIGGLLGSGRAAAPAAWPGAPAARPGAPAARPGAPRVRPGAPPAGSTGPVDEQPAWTGSLAGPRDVGAAIPHTTGVAERDGVSLAWAAYGDRISDRPTVLLMPTWSIVHSGIWKGQIAYLARHFPVLTFDGRGSGRSGRPAGAAAYTDLEYAADTVAVMDAAGVGRAVLVSLSCGTAWSLHVAADHPERVIGLFAISPSCGFPVSQPHRDGYRWDQRYDTTEGWSAYNRFNWLEGDYDGFLQFFFGKMFSERHSTKQTEDALGWARQVPRGTLVDTTAGRIGCDGAICAPLEPVCARVGCPVTVVHGTDDRVRPHAIGERLAELTGGSLLLVQGGGHGIPSRDPVFLDREIRAFVDGLCPPVRVRGWTRALNRPRKALYLSSPIGLGHAMRDMAIAQQLRTARPDLQIEWLAQHPVTAVLASNGETVHPASAFLASESGHIEHEAGEHDLHAFQAIRRMDEILVNNFMVFADLVADNHYDLVIGDEAWDVDYFLHENPELKRSPFAWMTDFIGWLPMPDGGAAEAALTADYNAEMIEQRDRFRSVRDRSIFVGNPGDIVELDFGDGLPRIRDWAADNFDFAGYVTGFDPAALGSREELRASLGYRKDERVCVVTVGGSGVGLPLLRRVLDAIPLARRLAPDLRFLVVAGPRIDPGTLPRRRGARIVGYQGELYRHLMACDIAVVQGGLTTCMELTAARRPFLYVPLRHHFEQNFHVRHRLEQYRAGRCLEYPEASDPAALAAAICCCLDAEVDYRPVESDGAARAAAMLAELL
ncbi:alpha/beta fold hydrolase [Nakamurella lactea]|uniref:alpha/beta fold hydrolase n=1 Tax=Nakamurella lactea TaxID=459515 RepID=UPI001B7FE9E9|nr:alpha/beta fold hydrolase [Nakamurella lactea]